MMKSTPIKTDTGFVKSFFKVRRGLVLGREMINETNPHDGA